GVMDGPVLSRLHELQVVVQHPSPAEHDDARRALEVLRADPDRDVILAEGLDLHLLPDARELAFGVADDPAVGDGGIAVVPGRTERNRRIGFDAGDAAAD